MNHTHLKSLPLLCGGPFQKLCVAQRCADMGQLGFYTGFIGNATAVVSWVDWGISPPFLYNFISQINQEALLSQRGRAMLRVCIASIQNVECSLLLLVGSGSDIPLRTIKFFSILFSLAYSSMLQAVTNKHSLVLSPTVRSTLHGRQ